MVGWAEEGVESRIVQETIRRTANVTMEQAGLNAAFPLAPVEPRRASLKIQYTDGQIQVNR